MTKVAMAEAGASRFWSTCPALFSLILFYCAYVIAGGFGQGLALIPGVSITFWPPAGIFLAMLLLHERATWPWWVAAACVAELTCNAIWFHNPVAFASVYFVANALEAVTAALLIGWYVKKPFQLDSLEEVAAFVVLGALIAPVVGATIIATTDALLGKHDFYTSWPLVWLGDSTGLLISTPLALGVVQMWRDSTQMPRARLIEAGLLVVVLAVSSAVSVRWNLATVFFTLPPLLWAAARFQLRGAAVGLALIAMIEALFTASASNSAVADSVVIKQNIVILQMFFGVASISALIVAALSQAHQKALRNEQFANVELEKRVAERTADLQTSDRFSRSILEASSDCVKVISKDGKLEFMNNNGCHLLEIDDFGMCAGLPWDTLWPEEARQTIANALQRALAGTGTRFEAFCPTAKGTPKWWDVAVTPVLDEEGGCSRIVSVSRDITSRKQADEMLQKSELRYRTLINLTSAVTWHCPSSGLHIEPQAEWMKFTGQSADDMMGSGWTKAVHPDDQRIAATKWHEAVTLDKPFFSEHRIRRYDGEWRWMTVHAVPITDTSEQTVEWFGMNIDVTERKQTEQRVLESEERFRVTFENAAIGMTHTTPEGKWLRVNDAFVNMTGYSREELLNGMSFADISHPDDLQPDVALLAELLAGKRQYYQLDKRYSLKQGRLLPVSIAVSLVRREDGTPDYLISSVEDISERTRQEQHQKLLLNELNHRVKNTLAMVQSMASQTMRNSSSLGDAKQRFEGRLMALSKAHDVLTRESWESAPLLDVVKNALSPYQAEGNKRFEFGGPDVRVPPHYALAIAMALHELCTNAVKYGSLSNDDGTVQFSWTISGKKTRKLKMLWQERGGPPVMPPKSRGFGSRLIERGLASDLGGEVEMNFAKTGVTCSIVTILDIKAS